MKMLVVDDDELSRDLLALLLLREGFAVTTAGSGEQAVALLEQPHSFEAVLCDLQMPGLSGDDLAQHAKTLTQAPIIAMSATSVATSSIPSYDGFLLKPFTGAALKAAIAGAASGAAAGATQESTAAPTLNLDVYKKLQASMPPEKLAQLYALCLDDAERRIASMQRAATEGDDAAYRREAHALKGGCSMLGATELQTLASSRENAGIDANHVVSLEEIIEATRRLKRMLIGQQNHH